MKTVKNVLFDLDGTLTDPFLGITNCIKYALNELKVDAPGDLSWCIGPPLQESFKELLKDHPDKSYEEGVRLYRVRFEEKGMFENEVYEGINELLSGLCGQGINTFVATSKPHIYAKQIIEHFGLSGYFKHVYGSELDGTRRNKVDLIAFILDSERLLLQETIMIGDRKHDLVGAKENDISCIGVSWGYGSLQELRAEQPEMICHTPNELFRYAVPFP